MSSENYNSAFGYWKVTEVPITRNHSGRSLGIYQGYIDTIAFYLRNELLSTDCYLCFEPIKIITPDTQAVADGVQASIALDVKSGTWNMDRLSKISFYRNLLIGREVAVKTRNDLDFIGVVLKKGRNSSSPPNEDLVRKALSKLTSEEQEALGF